MKEILENLWEQQGSEQFIEILAEWLAEKQMSNSERVWIVLRIPTVVAQNPDYLIETVYWAQSSHQSA